MSGPTECLRLPRMMRAELNKMDLSPDIYREMVSSFARVGAPEPEADDKPAVLENAQQRRVTTRFYHRKYIGAVLKGVSLSMNFLPASAKTTRKTDFRVVQSDLYKIVLDANTVVRGMYMTRSLLNVKK
jgi:hypothetical protein